MLGGDARLSRADTPLPGAVPRPEPFVVRILGPAGEPVGVGTLVGPREILTCAHVVNVALGLPLRSQPLPDSPVLVQFPLLPGEDDGPGRQARVERWTPPPGERSPGDDTAGLVLLEGHAPAGAHPARLAVNLPRAGHALSVFGYPGTPPRRSGAWVPTVLRGLVGGGRIQLDSGADAALRVQPGYSGSPVYDDTSGRVVGMLALAAPAHSGDRDSYAIAADRLRLTWPEVLDPRTVVRQRSRSGAASRSGDPRPAGTQSRNGDERLTVLHVSDPQFGRHHLFGGNGQTPADQTYDTLHTRLHQDLTGLAEQHGLLPDLLLVTGDLAEWGLGSEFVQVTEFLAALSEAAELPRDRVVIVPGNHDVNRKSCEGYFISEEGEERVPVPPYFPKWKQFTAAFEDFYADVPGVSFTPDEPWTLFEVPGLAVVVAGLNSTMAESHRDADHYGWVGETQLRWFADRLADYRSRGWLRLAAVHHNVVRGAVDDEENLRDADDLDRILGEPGLVNLLLHGHTHDGRLHRLPSGLVALSTGSAAVDADARPAEVPNQYQLVTIGRTGFTRYARQYAVGQRRWIGDTRISRTGSDWRQHQPYELTNVDASLPAGGSVEDQPESGPRGVELGDVAVSADLHGYDPGRSDDDFLGRVLEATRVRLPRATVVARPGANYLRVSNPLPDGDGVEQWAVGVLDGPPTAEVIAHFAGTVHATFAAADLKARSELVHPGPPAPKELVGLARRQGVHLRNFVAYQGLLDLGPLLDRQAARLVGDKVYPPAMYLPQRYRLIDAYADDEVHEGLDQRVVRWLGDDTARLVMVLGDFGRGKTALLRHLAYTLSDSLPDLQPVLVELRSLEKAPSLDELLAQHLIRHQVEDINPAKLRYMIRSGRLALLFDGFDELELRLGYDNATDYLRTLLESVTDRAKVVLTSRTQHFRSTTQVRTALGDRVAGLTASRVVVLEDFTPEQIMQFLTNLYDGDAAAARARYGLLTEIDDLLGLARNPRMLAFIAGLDEERLREVQRRQGRISAAELYRELVDFWLVGEANRQQHRRGKPSLDDRERLTACTALALRLWASTEASIPLNTLSAEVGATLTRLAERGYDADQAAHSVASGSLLVRADDDAFAFVHQSIMEWLVADAAAQALADGDPSVVLGARRFSPLMVGFFCDLAGHGPAAAWASSVLADSAASTIAKRNALDVRERVGVMSPTTAAGPARQSLAGVDLRSQDLAGQDLRGADLRGADLRGMRLEGLDLTGADLRVADFTAARLLGGRLAQAALEGSQWSRAALLGTELPADSATTSAALAAASIPGRDRATATVAPGGPLHCVAFSPTSPLIALSRGNVVELVDRNDHRTLALLTGHAGDVDRLVWSPDGSRLATAAKDRTARIWDIGTGQATSILAGHTDSVTDVAWSPDGTHLATGSRDRTARIWDTGTGQTTATLRGHRRAANTVAWSPDGTHLATGSYDSTVRIWDLDTGRTILTLTGHTDWVADVAYSPDGNHLATGSYDNTVRIWDLDTGQPITTLTGHGDLVRSVAYSPDGTRLATTSRDRTARIWDTSTGQTTATLTGHLNWVTDVAYSPDGNHLATASYDNSARIWTATGALTGVLDGYRASITGVVWSPDGTRLATASRDRTVRIWNTATGRVDTVYGHSRWVTGLAYTSDGARLATASSDNVARIWDTATGQRTTTLVGHEGPVASVAWSPDDTRLATASDDDTARIWNPTTRESITLTGHSNDASVAAWAPDGTRLATSSWDNTARIWDATTGESTLTLTGHTSWVRALAYSPDGTRLATGSNDNTVRIWNTTTGESTTILTGHINEIRALAYSPDGTRLATGSNDNTVRIWNTTTGESTTILTGHINEIRALAYSPDGTRLATGSYDNTVRIWNTTTGQECAVLVALPDDGYAVLLPDGSYRINGNPGNVLWWNIKLCRFEPGELDPYVPGLRPAPQDASILGG
ncbi:eIF2A-related protein [Plantactinospora soyae]|uniref:WD40 repeat protein n=1 Tax=Plantactinospora soyae TaxID=1544732 RepID=A0A927M8C5_9ACTN|nr:metallophosphoesterase [Plantactinospora soyae]MBE1488937.1 WD40 repeat protein [Plantactinospora soyae]